MDLRGHIEGTGTIREIASYLEGLSAPERAGELLALSKRHQRTLYLKAQCADPVQASDLLPEGFEPTRGLRHHGRNTLPIFRDFEKHFAHTDGVIYGFNEGSTRRWIGPGYFVCRPAHGPELERSAFVVDYFQVPVGPVPADWPEVKPNWRGLQVLVYHKTRDYLRRVCDGVLIGSAYKTILGRELKLDSYFLLIRGESTEG